MVTTLDFDDINNYLYLSNESNLLIAKDYVLLSVLKEAEAEPKFKKNIAINDIVFTCREETYNPLRNLELYENFLGETVPTLSSMLLDKTKPDLKTVETLIHQAEGYARNKYSAPYGEGDMGELMFWLGKLSLLSKEIFSLGADVRKCYVELVMGIEMLAQEYKIGPFYILDDARLTDEAVRLAFPNKLIAYTFFTKYRIPELSLFPSVRKINDTIIEHDTVGLSELTEIIPSSEELEEANELNDKYSKKEINRIYSS